MWTFWLSAALAGEHRAELIDLLSAYEDVPKAEELNALGEGVPGELIAIAEDTSVPHSRRGRAVTALGHYPTDAVRHWLEATLGKADGDALLRRKAAWSLAVAFRDSAVEALGAALADPDPQLRIATAQALGHLHSDSARAALTARLAVEPDATVRAEVKAAMEAK